MFVHYDLWDCDPPAPPNLITVQQDGNAVEAVAQITREFGRGLCSAGARKPQIKLTLLLQRLIHQRPKLRVVVQPSGRDDLREVDHHEFLHRVDPIMGMVCAAPAVIAH